MIDIKLIREDRDLVKENIKKKFQDEKLPLVDEVFEMDKKVREAQTKADNLKADKNKMSGEIGKLMKEKKIDEANEIKEKIAEMAKEIADLEAEQAKLTADIKERMMVIPNIIDDTVPIGKDDTENVEVEKFGDPVVPKYEIPYHADIIAAVNGMDKEAAGRTSGEGFYYLLGDIARLHEAMIAYARDFMIEKGFTYAIPPFMIHADVVTGVMSFPEMEAMMYKIENEDLYLIGTSEHSMIGKFKDQILKREELPITMTSYSPCFRKEGGSHGLEERGLYRVHQFEKQEMIGKFKDQILKKEELPITMTSYSPCFRKEGGSHGLEERGLYRVHQFEKQEMIVICEPEDSMEWYNKMWKYTVDIFRNFDIPVRQLECCSGDLADLKVKSCDIEAWSPRQQKYFEVGSCSTLGDAQARRLGIRAKGEKGTYYLHTLNNTVVASPRGLIALLENNYQEDGSIKVPKVLQPYMGGVKVITPKK